MNAAAYLSMVAAREPRPEYRTGLLQFFRDADASVGEIVVAARFPCGYHRMAETIYRTATHDRQA